MKKLVLVLLTVGFTGNAFASLGGAVGTHCEKKYERKLSAKDNTAFVKTVRTATDTTKEQKGAERRNKS